MHTLDLGVYRLHHNSDWSGDAVITTDDGGRYVVPAAALRAYGEACAAAEQERITQAALAIRADYPEEVFPALPAAAGARLAIDRLLAETPPPTQE